MQRIIPCLEQEFINPDMIPFILPNIFLIADQSNNEEYIKYILPRLKIIFKLQKPVQVQIFHLGSLLILFFFQENQLIFLKLYVDSPYCLT